MGQFYSVVSQAWQFIFRHMLLPVTLWIVFFIVLILYVFYRKYLRYAQIRNLRRRKYRLRHLIVSTRWVLLFMILLLVGTLTYGHSVKQTDVNAQVQVATVKKKTTPKIASKSIKNSSKSKSTKKSTSSKQASNKSTSSKAEGVTAERSVAIVKGYYESHPDDQAAVAKEYRFLKKTTDKFDSQVFLVGGFNDTGTTSDPIHEYQVHLDGKFDILY